jgi:hypothetical protein
VCGGLGGAGYVNMTIVLIKHCVIELVEIFLRVI